MSIGWYPGHMHKARKDITQALRQVDAVLEIVDARLPQASANPLLNQLIADKPRLRVLAKADLADPGILDEWLRYFTAHGISCATLGKDDAVAARGLLRRLAPLLPKSSDRPNRLLVVGIPNVGKSTLINLLAGRRIAKVGNEPAVTRARQEIRLDDNLLLFDTPGILWPKLEDQQAAYRLASSGAIRNTAIEAADVALFAVELLRERYPESLRNRYSLTDLDRPVMQLLEDIGRQRGCLTRGGVDLGKAGEILLNDLRSGKLGRLSLERPGDLVSSAAAEPGTNAAPRQPQDSPGNTHAQ